MNPELALFRAVEAARMLHTNGIDLHDACRLAATEHGLDSALVLNHARRATQACSEARHALSLANNARENQQPGRELQDSLDTEIAAYLARRAKR